MMKKWILIIALFATKGALAQINARGYFVAYEILEMSMNDFQYFAGEIGYRFEKKNQIRLTVMEVKLTERHLSDKYEALAIKGGNVKGYFRNYEINYDRFFSKHWYVSLNSGYANDKYQHTKLGAGIDHKTFTIGTGVGYIHSNLFGIKHFFLNFSIPVRYYFNHIEETKLGDSTVRPHIIVNNMWLFLGYKF